MVLGTANLTVEMAVGSQLSATVSEGDLRTDRIGATTLTTLASEPVYLGTVALEQ